MIPNQEINLKRYAPYKESDIESGEAEVPLRLLSAEEKIDELQQIIEEQKRQGPAPSFSRQPSTSSSVVEDLKEQLETETEKANHLQKEKKVISEILAFDILVDAKSVVQKLHQFGEDPQLSGIKNQSVEVFQKLSELINSVNQSIDDMNKVNDSQSTFRSSYQPETENRPPSEVMSEKKSELNIPAPLKSQTSMSQANSTNGSRTYERKLPPNVEAMLRQKREQLAKSLNH